MNIGFGIDLGTTRTSIGMVTPNLPERGWYGNAQAIQLPDGFVTPSAIFFEHDRLTFGSNAKNMGHRAQDCAQVFKREMPNAGWRFKPSTRVDEEFSAEDLSYLLLDYVANAAATATGLAVESVVVTVPAYFGEPERRRTRTAAERAGLAVLDVINEPTAAVLAYLFQPGVNIEDGSLLVFDLGGGTFDTVVVEIENDSLTVASIDGDLLLGGRDFDATICTSLADQFERDHPGADLPTADSTTKARLMLSTEMARESLSSATAANIAVWGGNSSAGLSSNIELTRAEMERILDNLFERCLDITDRALKQAQHRGAAASHVLFVGGATKTPAIRQRVLDQFSLQELTVGADPDLLVTKGAAIWAQKIILEAEFLALVNASSIPEVDWDAPETRSAINSMVTDTGYPRAMFLRLLKLDLHTITSRGYAIKARDPEIDEAVLTFLVNAGASLPFRSKPESFSWRMDVNSWRLEVYEDVDEHRGTRDPEKAKKVETVTGPMAKGRNKGESFEVVMELGRDQIIKMSAWHSDDGGQDDRLDVIIKPD